MQAAPLIRRSVLLSLLLVGILALGACASSGGGGTRGKNNFYRPYAGKGHRNYDVKGTASWYGRPFHGRRTASGERYNMNAMTAAHKKLPFGAMVRVTNLNNDKSVILKINDRGPFVGKRILDVSREAAKQLAFKGAGIARVRIEWIEDPANHPNITEERKAELAERKKSKPTVIAQKDPAPSKEPDPIAKVIEIDPE